MPKVTRYPINAAHEPLYRGDPVVIAVHVTDLIDTVRVPRPLAGTFWRAHIRAREHSPILTKWTVTLNPDLTNGLYMALTALQAERLVNRCTWDLEQVTNGADDNTTVSLGTYWKVSSAKVVGDVSHRG